MILKKEYTAVFSLGLVMAIRMLGLFMILPVFSAHASDFTHATPQLIGLALGVYGLTQGLLQIPFGLLSDHIGRRPVMSLGLGIFIAGSLIAAFSHSIYGLIIGRALQGGGAIGSTVLALVADLTRDENRSKAMAFMGMAIGGSFALAMVLGPLINAWLGLSGIFLTTALLAVIAELMIWLILPTPPAPIIPESMAIKAGLIKVLKDKRLLSLDVSILLLHAILTIFFMAVPFIFKDMQLTAWMEITVYLIVLLLAFALMMPLMILAEKKQQMKSVFIAAIGCLFLTQVLLGEFHQNLIAISFLLLIFFTAFSLLEAVLPSWVSKVISLRYKGFAMGCYSSAQFLGIFIGGALGGWCLAHYGLPGIFTLGAALSIIWLCIAFSLSPPPYLTTVMLNLKQFSEKNLEILTQHLYSIAGVTEVAIMDPEGIIYLKINPKIMTKTQLRHSLEKSKLICLQGGDALALR